MLKKMIHKDAQQSDLGRQLSVEELMAVSGGVKYYCDELPEQDPEPVPCGGGGH